MIETYYAGAYWPPRAEPAEQCARRAERFFQLLGHSDPAWQRWYEPGESFEHARTLQFTPNVANFIRLFARKKNQGGDGFRFLLWTGDNPEETSSISVRCGHSSPWLLAACVFTPPSAGPLSQRVLTASVLSQVVRAMVEAWEPEWCVATSYPHQESLGKAGQPPSVFEGWVTYFSRQRGAVPPLPAPVSIEPVADKGTLVTLTPERFTAANPEHVALASRVHQLLDEAGLLRPLQQR